MSLAAAIYPELRYQPTKNFVSLAMIAHFPLYLVVAENGPKSVDELVARAKQHPEQANYATTSPTFTIASELMELEAGMPATAVPYKSSGEMLLSVMSGQQRRSPLSMGRRLFPLIKAGKVRALAVTGSQRADVIPDVPAMSQTLLSECGCAYSGAVCLFKREHRLRSQKSSPTRSTRPCKDSTCSNQAQRNGC